MCKASHLFHPWHIDGGGCGGITDRVLVELPERPPVCEACQWDLLKAGKHTIPRRWSFLRRALDAWAAAVWEEAWEGLTIGHYEFKLHWTRQLKIIKTQTNLYDIVRIRRWSRKLFRDWGGRHGAPEVSALMGLTGLSKYEFRSFVRCLGA